MAMCSISSTRSSAWPTRWLASLRATSLAAKSCKQEGTKIPRAIARVTWPSSSNLRARGRPGRRRWPRDVRTLSQWLGHDVLSLAGPEVAVRQEMFDFVAAELHQREHEDEDVRRIRPMRVALHNQRDALLAFAKVLDDKLVAITQSHDTCEHLVRQVCLLHRLPSRSTSYWKRWNQLRSKLTDKFHLVFDAVANAMAHTPRCSLLVENLNSRLRTYFTLRRHLGGSYLALLQFFLNHRRFMRSRVDRQGKSPRELMTGKQHAHWFTLLELGEPQPLRG